MKTNKIELDVDFIGGQGPLTPTEEKALSDFFRERKSSSAKKKKEEPKVNKRSKATT